MTKIIRTWFVKYKKWIFLAFFIILFLLLVEDLFREELYITDDYIYHHISKLISPSFTFFFKFITKLGSASVLIGIIIATFIIFKNKRIGLYMSINLVCIFILNQLLKFFFERPRPIDLMIIEESGYSFPSGHSMVSMAFYGFIIFLLWKYLKNNKLKWFYTILLIFLIVLIGISRIYLGVHYATDVIAGFYISIAYLIVFTTLISNRLKSTKK